MLGTDMHVSNKIGWGAPYINKGNYVNYLTIAIFKNTTKASRLSDP